MDNIYTVIVSLGFGTGNPDWKFAGGTGRAISRSPKRAYRAAYAAAMKFDPGYGLIDQHVRIYRGTKLISETY